MKPEIIQQWQMLGQVQPELLADEAFESAQEAGVSSLESYFFWSEIEKEEGEINFSSYDVLVEKIKKHNLKWVPFLILGPDYATPEWFKESKESVFAECLEHQKKSRIQSIWNPRLPKYVERFLARVSEHYQDKDILESILLGISGNWGEAIYPGGGHCLGNIHSHTGFWCGDRYARENFINFALGKYQSLKGLNDAWGTDFSDTQKIDFPSIETSKRKEFFDFLVGIIHLGPGFLRKILKFGRQIFLKISKRVFFATSQANFQSANVPRQRWLDFSQWYLDSMTNWAEFWIKTARRYFPENKIYLVTGGLGELVLGADFVNQTKAAQKHQAGIRITNQTDDYAQSFAITRLVSSAARFYNTYFTTEEEAVLQTPEAVTMRIFDAVSSGAYGFYCRNIISQGKLPFLAKENLPIGSLTPGAKKLQEYIGIFDGQKPLIDKAIFFPNTFFKFNPSAIVPFYNQCAQIRNSIDFDLVDETMLKDGALGRYKHLLVLAGELPRENIPLGLKIISDPREIAREFNNRRDGVYASHFSDKILYYDSHKNIITSQPITCAS